MANRLDARRLHRVHGSPTRRRSRYPCRQGGRQRDRSPISICHSAKRRPMCLPMAAGSPTTRTRRADSRCSSTASQNDRLHRSSCREQADGIRAGAPIVVSCSTGRTSSSFPYDPRDELRRSGPRELRRASGWVALRDCARPRPAAADRCRAQCDGAIYPASVSERVPEPRSRAR